MTKRQQFLTKLYWIHLIIPLAMLVMMVAQQRVYAQQVPAQAAPAQPKPLNWAEPPTPRIQLAASAMSANDKIIYTVYPINTTGQPVWDLQISIPLPKGATFQSAWGSPSFISSFDGRAVTFTALELPDQNQAMALHFQVSATQMTTSTVVTQASASWQYVKTNLGQSTFAQETTKSGDITVQPHLVQQVISDGIGDVPFGNYDLTSITMEPEQAILKIIFTTAGKLGASTEPLEYYIYIDDDCNANTGRQRNGFGSEYRMRFRYNKGLADIARWEETNLLTTTVASTATASLTNTAAVSDTGNLSDTNGTKDGNWHNIGSLSVSSPANGQVITVWVPHTVLDNDTQFCWYAEGLDRTDAFTPRPPPDEVPDGNGNLPIIQYNAAVTATTVLLNQPLTDTASIKTTSIRIPLLLTSTVPLTTGVNGKLAISLKNSAGGSDVHIFDLPAGQELAQIANASQPSLSADGKNLLSLHNGTAAGGIYEYGLASKNEVQLSGVISGSYPFYDPTGKALVYAKATDSASADSASAFVTCDLAGLRQHSAPQCHPILDFGALAASGQSNKITGNNPIWSADNLLAYQGCVGSNRCGVFLGGTLVGQEATNDPFLRQLTTNKGDIPTDSKGNLLAFMTQSATGWDAYVMRLDGAWVKNISNNPDAQDGLPTISPDGKWVAFLSNRDGKWGVWVAPIGDGPVRKVFDLPTGAPWDDSTKTWTDQRITWAP